MHYGESKTHLKTPNSKTFHALGTEKFHQAAYCLPISLIRSQNSSPNSILFLINLICFIEILGLLWDTYFLKYLTVIKLEITYDRIIILGGS